jgi:LmbE family N-acetylglucosaminyl deacetylase
MKTRLLFLLTPFLFPALSPAQNPEAVNASDILLRMKKLQVLCSVLYVAAHPDDENTRLLAWLSKDKLYRTGYLSMTRGDGGQNLIGDEQGVELGLIRTQELLAARRVDGAEQFFTRAYDFGFSKTTSESLNIWNEQKILSDVVWVIRKFQPDVVITRFPEDKRAGHGQHSASAVLARLAFKAAADPNQFPEQFAFGVHPWQAKRLFLNTFRFGNINTTSEDQMKVEVGGYNSLEGKSYGEIAADSRSQHRSQGFGIPHSRGNATEYFIETEGEKADSSLMENVNCSWDRVPGGAAIGKQITGMISKYDPANPYLSVTTLVTIYKAIKTLPEGYWRDEKLKECRQLIQYCTGLFLEATVPEGYAIRNQTVPVTLHVLNRTPVSIKLQSVTLNRQDTLWNLDMKPGINYSLVRQTSLSGVSISQPYWLVDPMSSGSYNVQDQTLIGRPENPPALEANFNIYIAGESLTLSQPVNYKYTDPVKGEIFEPLTIVPSQMAFCVPDLLVFNRGLEKELAVRSQWKTAVHPLEENTLIHPAGLTKEIKTETAAASFSLTPVPGFETKMVTGSTIGRDYLLKSDLDKDLNTATWVTHSSNGVTDTILQCRTINYEHIPRIDYFIPAKSTIVSVNLKTKGNRIGYIDGAGDKISEVLSAMGYSIVKLNENNISPAYLENLDAVIAGVRAYDVHDWLADKYEVLMNYVKNGGNLIVQYNRNRGTDSTGIGPYPFVISNIRVTEENAPVVFLLPDHPVLHFPNEITNKDFEGWIQERGIYFAQRMDPRYQAVLSMHDSGEPDQSGSLIIAGYGKGTFTYTGLVFFRELPAGVPGAYRLLANLIALNKHAEK